jgi:hypothetical protein
MPKHSTALVMLGAFGCAGASGSERSSIGESPEGAARDVPATLLPAASASSRPLGAEHETVEVSIPTDGRTTALGLDIEVLENTEKRDEDGTELMRIGLRLRVPGREEDVAMRSPGREEITWGGYLLRYRGGWREAVMLTVSRLGP